MSQSFKRSSSRRLVDVRSIGRRQFYSGWFASCLVHRSQKLAAPLILIFVGKGGVNVAVHGFSQALIMVMCMPTLTKYLSSTNRRTFVTTNLMINLGCMLLYLLGLGAIVGASAGGTDNWLGDLATRCGVAIGITISIVSYVSYMLVWMAIRRDWPIQISYSRHDLTSLNANLESLELIADIVVGVTSTTILFVPSLFVNGVDSTGHNMKQYKMICGFSIVIASVFLLLYSIVQFSRAAIVYEQQLKRSTEELVESQKLAAGNTIAINRIRKWHVQCLPHVCSPFWRNSFCTPYYSIVQACSSLMVLVITPMVLEHFNALNPGNGLLANWLSMKQIPLYVITASKTLCSVLGAAAVIGVPYLLTVFRKETWMTAFFFGVGTVLIMAAWQLMRLMTHDTFHDNLTLTVIFVASTIFSKVSFYMFNVGANGIFQLYTPPEYRGLLNGIFITATNMARILLMGFGTFLPFISLVKFACVLYPIATLSLIIFAAIPFKPKFGEECTVSVDAIPSDQELEADVLVTQYSSQFSSRCSSRTKMIKEPSLEVPLIKKSDRK